MLIPHDKFLCRDPVQVAQTWWIFIYSWGLNSWGLTSPHLLNGMWLIVIPSFGFYWLRSICWDVVDMMMKNEKNEAEKSAFWINISTKLGCTFIHSDELSSWGSFSSNSFNNGMFDCGMIVWGLTNGVFNCY